MFDVGFGDEGRGGGRGRCRGPFGEASILIERRNNHCLRRDSSAECYQKNALCDQRSPLEQACFRANPCPPLRKCKRPRAKPLTLPSPRGEGMLSQPLGYSIPPVGFGSRGLSTIHDVDV